MIKFGIVGSRSFDNYELLKKTILTYCATKGILGEITIVSGGAKGADKLGEKFAEEMKLPKEIYLPNWDKHGRSAGFKRNIQIVENSDVVFAFWDGISKGTKHSIDLAKRSKKELYIINY